MFLKAIIFTLLSTISFNLQAEAINPADYSDILVNEDLTNKDVFKVANLDEGETFFICPKKDQQGANSNCPAGVSEDLCSGMNQAGNSINSLNFTDCYAINSADSTVIIANGDDSHGDIINGSDSTIIVKLEDFKDDLKSLIKNSVDNAITKELAIILGSGQLGEITQINNYYGDGSHGSHHSNHVKEQSHDRGYILSTLFTLFAIQNLTGPGQQAVAYPDLYSQQTAVVQQVSYVNQTNHFYGSYEEISDVSCKAKPCRNSLITKWNHRNNTVKLIEEKQEMLTAAEQYIKDHPGQAGNEAYDYAISRKYILRAEIEQLTKEQQSTENELQAIDPNFKKNKKILDQALKNSQGWQAIHGVQIDDGLPIEVIDPLEVPKGDFIEL